MFLKKWEDLPQCMQTPEVRRYYDILSKKRLKLFLKRGFDIVGSLLLLILLAPVFFILALAIKLDSPGPVFYRQERITQYNQTFRIFKFRSMVEHADAGMVLTLSEDKRVTRVGRFIRGSHLDETAQLLDVLRGTMSFVGTRPEVPRYTAQYTPEMMATLLLPAGITSLTSIYYSDEMRLLDGAINADQVYIQQILPGKMYYNLKGLEKTGVLWDIRLLWMTFRTALGKQYERPDVPRLDINI